MFTRNWYKALAYRLATTNTSAKPVVTKTDGTTTALSAAAPLTGFGCNGDNYNYTDYYGPRMRYLFSSYSGVKLGTGTTPPTIDDYTLSGSAISTTNLSSSCSWSASVDEDGATYTSVFTITNNKSNDITISEVGLFMSDGTNFPYMVERTVLDSPVTIPAGGVGQVTYTIRMNYPTT